MRGRQGGHGEQRAHGSAFRGGWDASVDELARTDRDAKERSWLALDAVCGGQHSYSRHGGRGDRPEAA